MDQLMKTWPGKAARDVFLGAVGGVVATSGSDGVFGLSLPAGDFEILIVAVTLLGTLYLVEDLAVSVLGLEDSDE